MLDYLLAHVSYLGIFVTLALTGCGLPIPEELIIIAAGWASATQVLEEPWLALLTCIAGAMVGDTLMYAIGYHFGHRILRQRLFLGRSQAVRLQREEQAERLIQRHGLKALFIARFLVGLRSMVYLAAGIMRMPFRRFILVDFVSASTVIGIVFGLSYRYANYIDEIWSWIRGLEFTMTAAIVATVALLVALAWRRHRRRVARVERRRVERLRQRTQGAIIVATSATLAAGGAAPAASEPARRSEPAA
ncbi:MAG: DedA family protein [Planctomycetaceae bacterium]|nr:DedA family protein [Planctomycetaceae bacterium]